MRQLSLEKRQSQPTVINLDLTRISGARRSSICTRREAMAHGIVQLRLEAPPEDDMSRPLEATSGITSVLLQLRQTTSGAEIREGNTNAGHTGWIDRKAADVTRDLLFENSVSGNVRVPARVRLLCNIILC